ncbi:MAG: nucleotidyltransferase domain-containing protein [Candidatus Woesearchaeota archaeon]|nr:nucleotidyltransferase domain-containing protein [Candidatus Woesearchaeota archaeon]
MNIYKQKFTKLQQSIMNVLYDYPTTTFNQRELAQTLHVSPTAIAKALPELEQEALITREKKKRIAITLNDTEEVRSHKRLANMLKLHASGIVEMLTDTYPSATVVLFGSYSKGDDTERSDIDIAIVGTKEKRISLQQFEEALSRTINIQHFPSWKIDKHLKESIINGVILYGYIAL